VLLNVFRGKRCLLFPLPVDFEQTYPLKNVSLFTTFEYRLLVFRPAIFIGSNFDWLGILGVATVVLPLIGSMISKGIFVKKYKEQAVKAAK